MLKEGSSSLQSKRKLSTVVRVPTLLPTRRSLCKVHNHLLLTSERRPPLWDLAALYVIPPGLRLFYLYFYWKRLLYCMPQMAALAGRYPAMCFNDSCGRWWAPRLHRQGFEWPVGWYVQFVHRADECCDICGLINTAVTDGAAAGARVPASSTTTRTRASR